jgi:hypothetical protein
MIRIMRTTVNIDDDVFQAARALSRQRGVPVGTVISEVLRETLLPPAPPGGVRNGLRLFPPRPEEPPVTPELVKRLLDESE